MGWKDLLSNLAPDESDKAPLIGKRTDAPRETYDNAQPAERGFFARLFGVGEQREEPAPEPEASESGGSLWDWLSGRRKDEPEPEGEVRSMSPREREKYFKDPVGYERKAREKQKRQGKVNVEAQVNGAGWSIETGKYQADRHNHRKAHRAFDQAMESLADAREQVEWEMVERYQRECREQSQQQRDDNSDRKRKR